ncbi:MAG TPA: hypothetical protein VGT41_01950 [Candidatus Babeliales bacterium]|nr:hypothetical protein [Candidatus Babeliales bacterium]
MKQIKKITIIGNAGSGKSVLARKLHTLFHLPVYHLDQYFWKPNWVMPDLNEFKIVHDELCERDAWIIEGMCLPLLEYRVSQADMIIFLDMPRYLCFWRIFKRFTSYYGQETPSSAKQCPEAFNWNFLRFLTVVWKFKGQDLPMIKGLLDAYASKKIVYTLQSQGEIDLFLKMVGSKIE